MEQCTNRSVGAVIERDENFLMIDRVNPPYGWAGVAGHVDEGKTPEEMIAIEIKEEVGLDLISSEFILEEMVSWNNCNHSNEEGHYWYLFKADVTGEISPEQEEVKNFGWFTKEELANLELEPVWRKWLEKLEYIKPS